jgi:hypothetical protein
MRCPRRDEIGQREVGVDSWRDDQTCSYCGSFKPEDFMAHLESGDIQLGSTDKNYKVYVHGLPRFTKFYFQHFDAGQRTRFIELLNGKKIRFEGNMPFYVLPFFVERKA